MKEVALVYLAAGISSRFNGKIKQFAKVGPNNETLIEYSLNQALPAGFTKIFFIVGNKTEKPFKEKFKDKYKDIPIIYVLQEYDLEKRDKPWGTADAVFSLKGKINCPFVLCNGDDIYGKTSFEILVNHLLEKNGHATMGYNLLESLPENGHVNRGVFEFNENNEIISIKEIFKVSKENFREKGIHEKTVCNTNLFAFKPEIIDYLEEILSEFKKINQENKDKECLLPEELGKLIKQNKIKIKHYYSNEKYLGLTNPEDEITLIEILKNKIN